MHSKLRTIALGVALAVTLGALVCAIRGDTRSRYEAAKRRLDADCRASRGNACNPHAPTTNHFALFKRGKAHLDNARTYFDYGVPLSAKPDLLRVRDYIAELDRDGTPIAIMMASKLLDSTLDLLETNAGRPLAASVLRRNRLHGALYPLEGQRLFTDSRIVAQWGHPFLHGIALDALHEEDSVTNAMDRAVRAEDVEGCIRAAKARSALTDPFEAPAATTLCPNLVDVVRTNKRLARFWDAR